MKVVVIGAGGQLGSDICEAFINNQDQVVKLDLPEFDISQPELVQKTLHQHS